MSELQTTQPTNPTALSRSGPIDPTTLLCMIVKTDRIELKGFDKPKTRWFAPGVRFVGMDKTGKHDLEVELAWQSSRTRKVLFAGIAMLGACLLLACLMVISAIKNTTLHVPAAVPVAWAAQKVGDNGLWIESGSNTIFIPVGSKLPNGEILLSTSAARGSYSTPSGVTTIGAGR